jgi:hypothetical protein
MRSIFRIICLTAIVAIVATGCSGSKKAARTNVQPVAEEVDPLNHKAQFPGGIEAFYDYLMKATFEECRNLGYENLPRQATATVKFMVRSDGIIDDVSLEVGHDPEWNSLAIRVVEGMPRWTPAVKDGEAVDSYLYVPVNFSTR